MEITQKSNHNVLLLSTGDSKQGRFLVKVPPKSRKFAIESLALPPGNTATYIQEIHVPAGIRLQRSRAKPIEDWGRTRGGAEQFEVLIDKLPEECFKEGKLLK